MSNYKEYVAASSRWMARALKAEAAVARVEALRDEWAGLSFDGMTLPWPVAEATMHKAASDLTAALAEPDDGGN